MARSSRAENEYNYVRFISKYPILGSLSFIVHAIAAYMHIIWSATLLTDVIPPVALSSAVYLLLDPLFLYAPLINEDTKCLVLDNRLKITALVFRSWGDLKYLRMIYNRLKDGRWKSLTREEMPRLAGHMVAVLPIPQVAILIFLPKMRGSNSLMIMKFLNSLIVLQYLTRVYPLYLLCKYWNMWTIGDGRPKLPTWSLIVVNIYGYIIASHIFGAFWYFFSILREIECWEHACRIENRCEFSTSCVQNTYRNITLLENLCPINPRDKQVFDFGIFHDALQSGMQGSTNFSQKCLRCFSWGIRNLSSFGSNLGDTSAYGWENLFVVLISISGLVLFMYLLGHVQTFMQTASKPDAILEKVEMIDKILDEYGLSNVDRELKIRIKLAVMYKLKKDDNLIVENLSSILSLKEAKNLAVRIKCSLFMDKLKKVDGLKDTGEEVLKKICKHLEPMIYTKGCYIIQEGEPLDMMFFVTRGSVLTYATNNGGSNGSSGTIQLEKEKDDLYGKELLTWVEKPSSKLSNLPISAITVKSHNKVEVFALQATNLQLVVSEFPSQFSLTIAVEDEIVN